MKPGAPAVTLAIRTAALPAAVAVGVLGWLIRAQRTDHRMEVHLQTLRREQTALIHFRWNHDHVAETVRYRVALDPVQTRRRPPEPGSAPLPPQFEAAAELGDLGQATPAEASETYLQALYRGDLGTLAGILAVSDTGRAAIESVFLRLPERDQADYGSPEAMFALLYAYENPVHFAGLQFVNVAPAAPDQASMTMRWAFPRGQIREHTLALCRSGDGWKVDVLDRQVDSVLRQALGRTP
jgi:hypothetical protein